MQEEFHVTGRSWLCRDPSSDPYLPNSCNFSSDAHLFSTLHLGLVKRHTPVSLLWGIKCHLWNKVDKDKKWGMAEAHRVVETVIISRRNCLPPKQGYQVAPGSKKLRGCLTRGLWLENLRELFLSSKGLSPPEHSQSNWKTNWGGWILGEQVEANHSTVGFNNCSKYTTGLFWRDKNAMFFW